MKVIKEQINCNMMLISRITTSRYFKHGSKYLCLKGTGTFGGITTNVDLSRMSIYLDPSSLDTEGLVKVAEDGEWIVDEQIWNGTE